MGSILLEDTGKGKLVALEGDSDILSTQLRLLPPSQKILILPSILENLPTTQNDEEFSARAFIGHIHNAFTERNQQAQSFLEYSTSTQPRLVFTHGGSVSARSTCIAWIAKKITNDKIDEAESVFNEIVKDGVAGLEQFEVKGEDLELDSKHLAEAGEDEVLIQTEEDPSTRAMKAADSLDREAAVLGEETMDNVTFGNNVENEGTSKESEQHSIKMPLLSKTPLEQAKMNYNRRSKIPVREFIFTASHGDEINRTVVQLRKSSSLSYGGSSSNSQILVPQLSPLSAPTSSPSTSLLRTESMIEDDTDVPSPGSETPVVVGEACLVDIQSPLRSVKSVDRFLPELFAKLQPLSTPRSIRHSASFNSLQKNSRNIDKQRGDTSDFFQALPRTTFVKASETTIRRSPTISDCAASPTLSLKEASREPGNQGTLMEEVAIITKIRPFEPVFPMVEDLILNLVPGGSNELFDAVIASYKNGSYPTFPLVELQHGDSERKVPRPVSCITVESDDTGYERRHTYDPYAYNSDGKARWSLKPDSRSPDNKDPPTPRGSSLPNKTADKVVDFSPLDCSNAVNLHNSLRQILSVIFPASNGYSQHLYPVSPGMERLWKPIFYVDESGSVAESSRTVDQIIALGCEAGVKQDFFSLISGQIEKLGMKKNGMTRSGKLDIRYFIAITMQTYSGSPESPDYPLSNPEVLAGLIIPHFESYLAINTSTRLLVLHYASEHLAVILALQRLIGKDILKVAGILDTMSSDPPFRPRSPVKINPLSNDATLERPVSRRLATLSLKSKLSCSSIPPTPSPLSPPQQQVSFSKANYLIPNTATDTEITIFLSSIWKHLMERSSFYCPEPEPPKPINILRPKTSRLTTAKSSISTSSIGRPTTNSEPSHPPPSSLQVVKTNEKIARMTGTEINRVSPSSHKYAQSITPTVMTTATERGRREDKAWENFYIAEEDSEDDEYDKMILGREFRHIVPEGKALKKRNTKKALKWLGLS